MPHDTARSKMVVVGGCYGLGSKDFTSSRRTAQSGIKDDVTHLSLPVGPWLTFFLRVPPNAASSAGPAFRVAPLLEAHVVL